MSHHGCLNPGFFEHFDTVDAIRQIEDKDIKPLVDKGVAQLKHNGDGEKCDLFGVHGPIRMRSRVYEVYLSPGIPSRIQNKVRIRFWYDDKTHRATLRIRESEYMALEAFLFPKYRNNGAERRAGEKIVLWGERKEQKVARATR